MFYSYKFWYHISVFKIYSSLRKYQKWSEIVFTKIAVEDLKNHFGKLHVAYQWTVYMFTQTYVPGHFVSPVPSFMECTYDFVVDDNSSKA